MSDIGIATLGFIDRDRIAQSSRGSMEHSTKGAAAPAEPHLYRTGKLNACSCIERAREQEHHDQAQNT